MYFLVVFLLGMGAGLLMNRWRPWGRESKPISQETTVERPVLLAVEPILEAIGDKGSAAQWSAEIAHMYRSWAKARRMQMHEVPGPAGSTVLAINGFGAEPRLLQEIGLHVLETESAGAYSASMTRRAAVRVSVSTRELAQSADQRVALP